MLGGLSEAKTRDDQIDSMTSFVKEQFENNNYSTEIFEAHSYKSQVVNGVNYFIKIKTDKEYVHVRVHQALPHNDSEISYHSQQLDKSKEDEITHF